MLGGAGDSGRRAGVARRPHAARAPGTGDSCRTVGVGEARGGRKGGREKRSAPPRPAFRSCACPPLPKRTRSSTRSARGVLAAAETVRGCSRNSATVTCTGLCCRASTPRGLCPRRKRPRIRLPQTTPDAMTDGRAASCSPWVRGGGWSGACSLGAGLTARLAPRAVLRTGVNAEGAGSAFLELGKTKVVCLVCVMRARAGQL